MTSELEKLCQTKNLVANFRSGEAEGEGWDEANYNWRVALRYQGRKYECDYFGGAAVENPTAADVVYSLCSDVRSHENDEYGELFEDSSEAIKFYKSLEIEAPKIRAFLGDDFDEFTEAEH